MSSASPDVISTPDSPAITSSTGHSGSSSISSSTQSSGTNSSNYAFHQHHPIDIAARYTHNNELFERNWSSRWCSHDDNYYNFVFNKHTFLAPNLDRRQCRTHIHHIINIMQPVTTTPTVGSKIQHQPQQEHRQPPRHFIIHKIGHPYPTRTVSSSKTTRKHNRNGDVHGARVPTALMNYPVCHQSSVLMRKANDSIYVTSPAVRRFMERRAISKLIYDGILASDLSYVNGCSVGNDLRDLMSFSDIFVRTPAKNDSHVKRVQRNSCDRII